MKKLSYILSGLLIAGSVAETTKTSGDLTP